MGHTTNGEQLRQLKRMRDMKCERLLNYKGRSDSFLKADISALNYAIRIIEAAQRSDILHELSSVA